MAAVDDPLISTFGRLVEVYSRLERSLGSALQEATGLPHTWFEVLVRLTRSDGRLTMGGLAGQIALTTGGVTRLTDRMESSGLVRRVPCPTDRRVSYITLTDAGRAKLEQAAEVHAANLRQTFTGFSDRERATLDTLLDRLRAVDSHSAAKAG